MSTTAKLYIGSVACCGAALTLYCAFAFQSADPVRLFFYTLLALMASGLKLRLPGVTGTMSVHFLFLLIGALQLTLPETFLLGLVSSLMQSYYHALRRPTPVQVAFNVSATGLAVLCSHLAFAAPWIVDLSPGWPPRLGLATVVLYIANTTPVALVIALTEGKAARQVWRDCYFWCFPYYLAGATIAGLFHSCCQAFGWQPSLLVLPVVFLIYRSYQLYLGKLADERDHAKAMASLHLQTIEALALAIDAKDQTTHDHLQRVQVYAVHIARRFGLPEADINALQAAAILHDIGKLAVPEHIISKPGKLTAEEFEKMKIHPVVGAEILSRVSFPYDVVPIVRWHHEHWDGSGYPDGLKGGQIPIGARILAAVDCLDAMSSDRQYRRALPIDEAMAEMKRLAGTQFDPRVVEILGDCYRGLEAQIRSAPHPAGLARLSRDVNAGGGHAPAAGSERPAETSPAAGGKTEFLTTIAAARQEVSALFELSQDLGRSLSLGETLSVMATRLKRLVQYDCIAIWVHNDGFLTAEYVSGDDAAVFSGLQIPVGQGLSGWVFDNRRSVVNGNPSVEPGYLNDPTVFSVLNSALAVALESGSGPIGVIALYARPRDAFSRDHLRILLAIAPKLASAIDNALRFKEVETSATKDFLTGLPNAGALFLHLDAEVSRCGRAGLPLTVFVIDLDGFKQVNDRFGHLAGNQALAQVGGRLRAACRNYDYVARMGGDEFVVVLPGLDLPDVPARLEEFTEIARSVSLQICGDHLMSASIGEAHYPAEAQDAEELLAIADKSMYRRKVARKRGNAGVAERSGSAPRLPA